MKKRIEKALRLPRETAARQLAAMHRAAASDRAAKEIYRAIVEHRLDTFLVWKNGCLVPIQ